jgi:hypothetical protein
MMRRRLFTLLLMLLAFYCGKRFAEWEHRPIVVGSFHTAPLWPTSIEEPRLKDLGPTEDLRPPVTTLEPTPSELCYGPNVFFDTVICQQET